MLPPFLGSLIGLLMALMLPAALGCLALAGWSLRQEGGINFLIGGSFLRYILWAGIFLTVPGIILWFSAHGMALMGSGSTITANYMTVIQTTVTTFVSDIVVNHLVPVMAAVLVLKAILDLASGENPLGSIVASLFLLGIYGIYNTAQSWNDGTMYATTDFLASAWNFLASQICPLSGALAIGGAVISYVANRNWMRYAACSFGLLTVSGLWYLIKSMAGV
jgi:hypothetical protein